MLLEYPACSGLHLEEADSFHTVLDWNDGQKTFLVKKWGENFICNFKIKAKMKRYKDFCY